MKQKSQLFVGTGDAMFSHGGPEPCVILQMDGMICAMIVRGFLLSVH